MPDIVSARPSSGSVIASAWGDEVHDQLEGLQMGSGSWTPASFPGNGPVVTFPRAYTAPPIVVVCYTGGSRVIVCTPDAVSATGFTPAAARHDGNATGAAVSYAWIAIGTPA